MKPIRFFLLITVIITISVHGLSGQGHRISVYVPDLPEMNIILSHRLGMKFYTDDTLKTDNFGRGEFEGGTLMAQGMYQLVFPDKKFAEFFIDKNQVFSMYTRGMAPADSLIFTGSPENSRFQEWQRKYTANRNRSGQIQNRLKKGNLT
ncbi:MAG: hypothetical protein WCW62_18160, partial [Bacteroidales bacterium]